MAGVHSRFSPSSLYLTMACSGSLTLRETLPPEPDSPESIEGTVAHHVAMQLALGAPMKESDKYKDVEIDEDMIAGAELWVNTVGTTGAFESPVPCPDVHADCWGTPDFWDYDAAGSNLIVWDYKYGHRYVEEFENIQLAAYASGIARMLNLPSDTVVVLGIVQPRCYMAKPVRHWMTTVARVIELAAAAGKAVADALLGGWCRTGPHCIDCPARGVCKTLQYATNRTLNFIQAPELNDPSPEALGMELSLLNAASDLVEARRKALAITAESMLRSGKRVPGWELKPGRAVLAWNDPATIVQLVMQQCGVDISKPKAPITPTQALSKKLLDEAAIAVLASRPPAPMELAPVSTVTTRKLFGA